MSCAKTAGYINGCGALFAEHGDTDAKWGKLSCNVPTLYTHNA